MSNKQFIIYIVICLTLLYIGTLFFVKEAFEDTPQQEMPDDQEITAFMTTASEYICPTYDTVMEEVMKEFNGSDDDRRVLANQRLTKEAQGTLFPCPPPADPIAVPADIDERIKRTLRYFNEQIIIIKKKVESSLGCPTKTGFQNYSEPFAAAAASTDICREEDMKLREKHLADEASISAANKCVAVRDLELKQRIEILAARKKALIRVMTDKQIIKSLAKLKGDTQELIEFKKSLLEGKVMSNCPT